MQAEAIAHARVKTDKIDAHILAQLLRADFIPEVEMPGEATRALRQLMTHRQLLARHRTAARNTVCGILNRKLLKPPLKELFGPSGRRWLLAQPYTDIERLMLDNDLAHLDALEERIRCIDPRLRELASHSLNVKLLMTIPIVNVTVVIGLMAAIGDISHLLTHQEPFRYAPVRRTRTKLRRVTPGIPAAKTGCIPSTLETVYAEIGLPEPRAATAGEKRAAANNRRCVTRHRKAQAKESIGV